jgi:hypothetical protein
MDAGDGELIAAVAAGDDAALRELFERHAPWLAARLRRALPAAAVEDVVQETFIAAWRGAKGYAGGPLEQLPQRRIIARGHRRDQLAVTRIHLTLSVAPAGRSVHATSTGQVGANLVFARLTVPPARPFAGLGLAPTPVPSPAGRRPYAPAAAAPLPQYSALATAVLFALVPLWYAWEDVTGAGLALRAARHDCPPSAGHW